MYNIYIDNQFSEINGASMFEKIMSKTNTYNNLNNEIIDLKNENRLLKKQIKLMKNHWHSTEDYNYLKNTFSSINKENNMLKKELENCNNLKKQNDDLKKELDRITNIKQQNEEIKKELESISQINESTILIKKELENFIKSNNTMQFKKELDEIENIKKESEILKKELKNYDNLKEENNELKLELNNFNNIKEENNELKSELDSFKKKTGGNFYKAFYDSYGIAFHFCFEEYLDYYFRDDFEDIFKEITQTLDAENREKFKWFFLRILFVNLLRRNTLFMDFELEEQKTMVHANNAASEFKFKGGAGYHPFDLGFTEQDKKFIRNKDIIDAGAYIGDTSLPFSKLTNKNVWAFEPFTETYELLVENIQMNNISNVVPVKKSLGNTNGEKSLFLTGTDFSGITSKPEIRNETSWEEIKVEECTLDKFVEENNLNVGYINVDVEGAELDLLNGAINTITTQKPILAISIYHQAKDFFEIIPWINNLNVGYEFELVKENPKYFLQETMVMAKVK